MTREYKFKESKLIKPKKKSNKIIYMVIIVLFIISIYIIYNNDTSIDKNEVLKVVPPHPFNGTITNENGTYLYNQTTNVLIKIK